MFLLISLKMKKKLDMEKSTDNVELHVCLYFHK